LAKRKGENPAYASRNLTALSPFVKRLQKQQNTRTETEKLLVLENIGLQTHGKEREKSNEIINFNVEQLSSFLGVINR
jgi:hypothetical protein